MVKRGVEAILAIARDRDDSPGDPNHRRALGHGPDHDRTGTNPRAVSDLDVPQDARVGPHHDVLAQLRVALPALGLGASEDDTFVEDAPLSHRGGLPDDDTHSVVDKYAFANPRPGVNLDTGNEAVGMRDEASG